MIIIEAILKINPNAKVAITDNDINQIEWLDGTTPISKSDLEAKMSTIEAKIAQVETDKQTKKASAVTKLKALGLTDEEIGALKI